MKKVIFMGTPDFASYILEGLLKSKQIKISLVVTQPDRPFGRKKLLKESEVKKIATKYKIPVFQPENIKNDYGQIINQECDLIITAAYGQIVPIQVLNAPKLTCINIHGSLLPKYRGGAPIHYAVINGDKTTGISIIEMVERMDAGDILFKKEVSIKIDETTGDIYNKLKVAGLELLLESLPSILNGNYSKEKQNELLVTFSPNISKEFEEINFNDKAFNIHNHIRGLYPFPIGYCIINNIRIKLFKSELTGIKALEKKTVYKFDETGLFINCEDEVIKISSFQIAGKKKMEIKDYINGGLKFTKGDKL